MPKKYTFERGDYIGDSVIRYVSEAGYKKSHRLVLGVCDFCNVIQPFRLEAITSGHTKSCGCRHRELVKKGKLKAYSASVRQGKPSIRGGGWRENGYVIHIPRQYREEMKHISLSELIEKIEEQK